MPFRVLRLNHREDGHVTSAMQGTRFSLQAVPTEQYIMDGKNLTDVSHGA